MSIVFHQCIFFSAVVLVLNTEMKENKMVEIKKNIQSERILYNYMHVYLDCTWGPVANKNGYMAPPPSSQSSTYNVNLGFCPLPRL